MPGGGGPESSWDRTTSPARAEAATAAALGEDPSADAALAEPPPPNPNGSFDNVNSQNPVWTAPTNPNSEHRELHDLRPDRRRPGSDTDAEVHSVRHPARRHLRDLPRARGLPGADARSVLGLLEPRRRHEHARVRPLVARRSVGKLP